MPPSKHALLSASSAARWIACPPSARLTEHLPDRTSPEAEEGTQAHALCEALLRRSLPHWRRNEPVPFLQPEGDTPEMLRAAKSYAEFIHGLWLATDDLTGSDTEPILCIEQRISVEEWVPGGFGTCDCLLIGGGVLHIVDFKYGKGVPVSCDHNPQLMYYALGAYNLFGVLEPIHTVRMSIVQPRMQEEPQTCEMPLSELLDWAQGTLAPAAKLALAGKGEPHPDEATCRFCKARPACSAWQDKYGALAGFEPLPDLHLLTDEELGSWLQKVQGLAQYAHELEEYAHQRLTEGHTVPGWKLVEGRSARKWTDQEAAFRQMQADGIDEAMLYTRTPITLTLAEKLLGKKQFAQTMAPFVTKAPGAPKLALDSDPRPTYNRLEGFAPTED